MTTSAKPSMRVVPDPVVLRADSGHGVPRSGVLQLLERSTERVVGLSAPAGWGKSTVARQWAALDPRHHAVVPLSPHLDDPARLGEALVGALGEIGPATRRAGARVTAVEPDFSAVVLPLVADLVAGRSTPFVLTVDDVHLVRAPACHVLLRTVAESVPPGSQLLLASRAPMPTWLSRLRVEGEVLDVGTSDLAFDAAEARHLFTSFGVDLDEADASAEVSRAEGWAVGLCLSARSGAARPAGRRPLSGTDVTVDDAGAVDRYVSDYVRSEMLEDLAEDDRAFLVRASVLDTLTPDACDAVLERRDSASVLARLHDEILLLLEVDPARPAYRFHHLLERALNDELVRTEPNAVRDLNTRAAEWCSGRGDVDTAVVHAKKANDIGLVGRLVWASIGGCVGSGRPDRLAGWLSDLDEADLLSDRWLSLATAWSHLQTGRRDDMERWMRLSERHAGQGWRAQAGSDDYAASLAVLVALGGRGTLTDNIALCDAARRGLPADSPFQSAAAFIEGVARTLTRDVARGMECLADAERYGRTLSVPIIEADSLSWQGLLLILGGDAVTGARTIFKSIEICRAYALERLASSAHSVSAQALALALLHDRTAEETLVRARRLSVQVHELAPWVDVILPLVQARAAVALGHGPLARQLVTEAKTHLNADLAESLASDLLRDVETSLRLLSVDGVSAAALTAAEMRVLQFLPSHLTFPQIGEHLFLTANTVKTHAHSIYRKLSVTSRDDAVLRARSLGLVESTQRL